MFRLEFERKKWREGFRKSALGKNDLAELESHLLDLYEEYLELGFSEKDSFVKAQNDLGIPDQITRENQKAIGRSWSQKLRNLLSYYLNLEALVRILAGLLIAAFFVGLGILLEGGNFSLLTQLTAFLIIVGGTFGALLMTYPVRAIGNAFRLAVTGNDATQGEYLEAAHVFKSLGDLAILANFLSLCLGGVHVAEHAYRSPESIGLGLAVCFVASVYALTIKMFIAKPMQDNFNSKVELSKQRQQTSRQVSEELSPV